MELALQITLIVTSLLVVLLVLLHRAKGGGLSTLFGGGVQSSLSGSTVVEKNLDRLTLFVTGIWVVSVAGAALLIKTTYRGENAPQYGHRSNLPREGGTNCRQPFQDGPPTAISLPG